ncbi:DUF3136 domain-containing protein [Synechococcus sp. BA-124 BA4]|jgi:hypothetical protein|uniref:DUF3136 domain-containing protein n=1 Tax=unclassified Synechococcus TaxID=2626047 RepID=UPI0018CCC8E3|nr:MULTISPECIES: DUF3136 domain-containing protein [unclassified Synechococcus]MEA5399805.1 DUF3136 domain-containing protein [Synechococcus sp. BA-124 BA4]QPN56716.1 DUF3136 domain-containing protein [Synechococcus sp. CBW1107]CAK6695962.1 hypothetical protein BBFGKLBO_01953 [Synechococcus sp. CBW1107]
MADSRPLSIGELEAGFSAYCQALRRLVADGRSLERIERTLCWHNLSALHGSLPHRYRSPEDLYRRYLRALSSEQRSD